MTSILLTGFQPFGGDESNPSWLAASMAADLWTGVGDLVPVELPVTFGESARLLREAIDDVVPDLVVCAGLAAGAPGIRVERVAINVDDARIPDNASASPIDEPIRSDGPAAYFSTLPIKAIARDLNAQGIVAQVSNTAGTYVCNHVFYSLMDYLAELNASDDGARRGGFVHVPSMPVPDANGLCSGAAPALPIEVSARALLIAIQTALRTPTDARLGGGSLH